ncbi:uncharacterized protein LOC120709498 isoform X3 [Panicum virgatum]|uniref:Spt20-like SEP domain-containing protein n=1 Tax=Panicum virgatum TaxID=38727 RepID=A0A8T0SLC6_PANVG|nr:uncharacterized protein LOC120709498 isoform X3 [Panicum virgatum]KAG2597803.1 hypothetical protein PVAP13_5KG249800 [Panicum virgatum]
MVVSFRLSRRGRRVHPPPLVPLSASIHAGDDSRPHAAAFLYVPPPPPYPPCEAAVSRLHAGIAARSELTDSNETIPAESDLEPSFALNLFPDGYSVGEPGKGMLLYLIGDDPKKRPYSRASRALLSDIEHGFLPQDILHDIPCKFQNGSTLCEVRDYRSVFCNVDDYSGHDFPRVNRVHLRLGTECVVKDLSSIADAAWTYHDQLTAESIILNALQPRLNLDPTPCPEMLCNSSAKKIDLGLNKGRQHNKDTSVLMMSINPPKDCMTKEFNICKGATLCIKNAALEGTPSGLLDSLPVNCPSPIHVNNAKSAASSDTNNMVQSYSTLPNSSALCDRMQCASDMAPDHLFQGDEQRAQVEILQAHRKTGQPQWMTVLPHKTKKPSNLLHEKHEFKKCSTPNKNGALTSQNCKGLHKSTISRNKTVPDLGSPKRLQVDAKVGQTIGKKSMEVQKQVPFSVPPRDPCTSFNTTNPSVDRIPENVKLLHKRSNERHVAPILGRNNSDMVDVNVCETATKSQGTASKKRGSETSIISLNHETKLEGKRQQSFDTQVNMPCKNRRFEEPAVTGGISSQLDIDLELDKGRQQIEDMSLLNISANAPECCKPNEFNVCKVLAVCSETAALKVMPTAMYNNRPLNFPSSVHVNNTKSIVESDPGSALQSPCTLTNSRALCDRKQAGSITPDNEEQPQVTVSQVDRENRKMRRVTIVPQKRKKSLKLLNERHGSKNHGPPNRNELSSQNFKRDKSTGSSNNYVFHLNSPKGQQAEVNVGQIIGNEDMKVQEKAPLSVNSSCHPRISLSTSDLCVEKIPEQVKSLHTRLIERHEVPVVDLKNYDMADPRDSRTPSVTSFSANSSKVACEPGKDKAATEYQLKALNRKVTGTISMNQEFNLNGKRQQKFDIRIEPPCENRSLEEPAITGGVNGEPDIEKIISEVIQTTQRHGLNEKAAKSDVLETSWLLPPCEFFQFENVGETPVMRDETMTCNVPNGATRTWKIRRLTFHPSQYSSCSIDKSQYTLCLLDFEPLDHQITVGAINGDEQVHIATLPTSCHAEKFVDQFILLMKREGYNLCNDEVCNGSSELTQQSQDVSHLGCPSGEHAEYQMFSPSPANSLLSSMDKNVGCTFQNKLPDFHATFPQPLTQQLVLTEQPLTLESPEVFFLNSSHLPGSQQYTGQYLQDQVSSFACNPFATNPHQFPSVYPSQEVSLDQYLQRREDIVGFSASRYNQLNREALMDRYLQYRHDFPGFIDMYGMRKTARYSQWCQEFPSDQYLRYRCDIPWFSDAYGARMSTSNYSQWRQVCTQMGNVVYQWDLPSFSRQINNSPPLHNGSNTLPELQPIRRPQVSSRSMDFDGNVTSTTVQIPMPLGFQFPSQGMW